jgi:hypothetical protein
MWCECWNIKINEDKTQVIYFSHRLRPSVAHFMLNEWNIPFVNHVKYLSVIFDERITWRLHIEMIETKTFRTFIKIYSLFKSEHLNANIKLMLHKALIRSYAYACSIWELASENVLLILHLLQNKVLRFTKIFQGAHWSTICAQLSTIQMYTII